MPRENEIAVFGGGCFWCMEAVFEGLKGVVAVTSGYAGGYAGRPAYEDVSDGHTGHAEVIRVAFDPERIAYADLLAVFFASHDPTTLNRQGADIGTQYRSIILYGNEKQKEEAENFIAKLNEDGQKVVTEIAPLLAFYEAEGYHQKYYRNNSAAPYCQIVINPKLEKLKERFDWLLKND